MRPRENFVFFRTSLPAVCFYSCAREKELSTARSADFSFYNIYDVIMYVTAEHEYTALVSDGRCYVSLTSSFSLQTYIRVRVIFQSCRIINIATLEKKKLKGLVAQR